MVFVNMAQQIMLVIIQDNVNVKNLKSRRIDKMEQKDIVKNIVKRLNKEISEKEDEIIIAKKHLQELELELRLIEEDLEN